MKRRPKLRDVGVNVLIYSRVFSDNSVSIEEQ